MPRLSFLALLTLVALLAPYGRGPTAVGAPQANRNFRTHLSGDQEVPPVQTQAQGQLILQLSKDGAVLDYKLIVANIEDVTQAHLHLGAAGVNGPPVAFLFGPVDPMDPTGRVDGILAEGSITAADLINPLAGQPLSALIEAMRAGNIYANVHTVENPGGEIRGQL
jgi:hypothetical protein